MLLPLYHSYYKWLTLWLLIVCLQSYRVSSSCHTITIRTLECDTPTTCGNCDQNRVESRATSDGKFTATGYPEAQIESDCLDENGKMCNYTLCDEPELIIEMVDKSDNSDNWFFQILIDGVLTNAKEPCENGEFSYAFGFGSRQCDVCDFNGVSVLSNEGESLAYAVPMHEPNTPKSESSSTDENMITVFIGAGAGSLLVIVALFGWIRWKKRKARPQEIEYTDNPIQMRNTIALPMELVYDMEVTPNPIFNRKNKWKAKRNMQSHPAYSDSSDMRHWPSSINNVSVVSVDIHESEFTDISNSSRDIDIFAQRISHASLNDKVEIEKHRQMINEQDLRKHDSIKHLSAQYANPNMVVKRLTTRKKKLNVGNTSSIEPAEYQKARKMTSLVCERLVLDDETVVGDDTFADSERFLQPEIKLEVFLSRLIRYLDKWFYELPGLRACGSRSLLISVLYLERMRRKQEAFKVTKYNVHRLFAVAMLLAAKFAEDEVITNNYWADVCGIPVEELNLMEERFCAIAGYQFWVTDKQISTLYDFYDPYKAM